MADAVRVATLASAVVAGLTIDLLTGLSFGGLLAVLLIARVGRLPGPVDAALAATLLAATWSGALGGYTRIWWLDLVIHFGTNGAAAGAMYAALSRYGIISGMRDDRGRQRAATVLTLTTSFGIALGVCWEFLEWLVRNLTAIRVHVGYDDTISDLAAGALGSVVAGCLLVLGSRSARARRAQNGAR